MEQKQVKREFGVLKEAISPDNVLAMAELITAMEMKHLIAFVGAPMIAMRRKLYRDILCKDQPGYVVSDSYDFVQTVALYLCEHIGEYLTDVVKYNSKGKKITVQMMCCREIMRIVDLDYRDFHRLISYDNMKPQEEPSEEMKLIEQEDYSRVDAVIERMGLNEIQTKALSYRMNGMSYPEIGRMVNRCQATVFEMIGKFKSKFNAVRAEFGL